MASPMQSYEARRPGNENPFARRRQLDVEIDERHGPPPNLGMASRHPPREYAADWALAGACARASPPSARTPGSRWRVLKGNMIEHESARNHDLAAVKPESEVCR